MSTLYLIALCGFCALMLGLIFDAVAGVSRKPVWHAHQSAPPLARVESLPLVDQGLAAGAAAPRAEPIPVYAVASRHSGFVGLTNNEDFELTA